MMNKKADKNDVQNKTGKADKKVDKRNTNLRNFSMIATVLFITIILIFNLVFDNMLGDRLKWDWTADKLYSIGDVSEEIIGSLEHDIEIIGLFAKDSQYYSYYEGLLPMLDEYVSKSNGRISLSFIDPDIDPTLLKRIDPENLAAPKAGTFVVYSESTGKLKNLVNTDIYSFEMTQTYETVMTGIIAEQSITGALRYVDSESTPVIYFTSGHEELDHNTQYKTILSILSAGNYDVKSLDLFGADQIPQDCAALIMAEPKRDITATERELIDGWLQQGGSLMIMSSFNTTQFTELNQLLSEYNIQISSSRLRDEETDNQYQQDMYAIRANAPAGALTTTAIDRYTLVLNARGLEQLRNERQWLKVEPILTTSAKGVAEADGVAEQASAQDVQNIGLLAEHSGWVDGDSVKDPAKVIVYGSSDLFREDIIQTFGTNLYNPNLFYNSIVWLAGEADENNLMISPKVPTSYAITKGTSKTIVATAVIVMLIIPMVLLTAALIIYRKRRHL